MKRVYLEEAWPESWKYSYAYDLQEIYGEVTNRAYALAYQLRRRETLRMLTRVLPPGSRILDVGAAQGNFSLAMAEMGYRVTWNDLRAELADYVRLKHEQGDIDYAPGNAFELNFTAPFDGVVITEIIEHVAHPDEFLRKVAQLIRPGGHILMTTPNGAYFRNGLPKFSDCADPAVYEGVQFRPDADGHIFLLHPEEIPLLAKQAGLRLKETLLFMNPLTTGHIKTAPLLRILPEGAVMALESMSRKLPMLLRRKALHMLAALFQQPARPDGGGG